MGAVQRCWLLHGAQSSQGTSDTWRHSPVHPVAGEQLRVGAEREAPLGPEERAELAAELWVLRPWYFLKTPFGLICSGINELVQHVWPSPKEKGYGAERNNVNSCVCVWFFVFFVFFLSWKEVTSSQKNGERGLQTQGTVQQLNAAL